jgi:N-acetylglucosamine kinase-like BadF-type ATPase
LRTYLKSYSIQNDKHGCNQKEHNHPLKPFLLIDSGATKLQWVLADASHTLAEGILPGLHPFLTQAEVWRSALLDLGRAVSAYPAAEVVYYYGTGCAQPAGRKQVAQYFQTHALALAPAYIETDLLGAARALCQRTPGIVCILGTGSNAAYYDGALIREQRGGLGYVLGDEGSGASVGKIFLQTFLNHQLPTPLHTRLLAEGLDRATVISNLYRADNPSRYLASFAPQAWAVQHQSPILRARIIADYAALATNALLPLAQLSGVATVHFTGSVAVHFRTIIAEVLAGYQLRIGLLEQQPMALLLDYHQR